MDQISAAVQAARYNEAVVVNVEDEDGVKRELVLVATIDAANGGVVWKNVSEESNGDKDTDVDDDIGIRCHLRTKRWVLPMLNDKPRNEMYQEAIQQACKEAVAKHKELTTKDVPASFYVLDIGSGTGLLAMMASKYTAEALRNDDDDKTKVEVLSLEMASAMSRLARQTVASNAFKNISIQEEHSCEITVPDSERAMLCTSELLESGLLGEGILPALRDAWDRHLHPNAIMVPQRARVYAQLLGSSNLLNGYAGPSTTEIDFGKKRSGLRLSTSSDATDSLLGNVEGVLVPIHAGYLLRDESTKLLSDPLMVMDFDFMSPGVMPGPEGRSRSHSILTRASGVVQAVLFWWELDLYDGITYSTECGKQPWQDHWQQCLHVFTDPSALPVQEGKDVCLICHHTDTRISFSLDTSIIDNVEQKRPKTVPTLPLLTPLRSRILADSDRIGIFQRSIGSVLSTMGSDELVLDMSDFSLCGVVAALSGAKRVVCLESSSLELPMMSARLAQLGNRLPSDGSTFEILQCHSEQLSLEVIESCASLVVAEPYYEMLEGWHLQECINYFFLLRSLSNRDLLMKDYVSIPSQARIMGCALQSDAIHGAYQGCGDDSSSVCGFDHSMVNKLGARYHEYDLSIPLWQYTHSELTTAFEIARMDYNKLVIEGNGQWKQVPFLANVGGVCHGLLLWIEYSYPSDKIATREVISTKGSPYNQVVRLMKCPVNANKASVFRCRIKIDEDLEGKREIHDIELKVGEASA
jgi:protein arginine N-methyltransferase 7